jgi:site-specific DNA-methyltransferase (adenine-specific)
MNTTAQQGMEELLTCVQKGEQPRFTLIHSDLPFNTNATQKGAASSYEDRFGSSADFGKFLQVHVKLMKALLAPNGLLALQLDDREHTTLRSVCDEVMGRHSYRGTIIWHYDTGGLARSWWSMKHQYIVLYASGQGEPKFNPDAVPVVMRKAAPKKVKNAKGDIVEYSGDKKITSVWNMNWSTTDPQRTGYPSQKPLCLAQTLIEVHTDKNDWVLDPFCGSGTAVVAAARTGRYGVGVDKNADAIKIAESRC